MELEEESDPSCESTHFTHQHDEHQVKELKPDGVRDFYVSDFKAKYLSGDKSKKYMILADGVKIQRVMSMNWLIKEAHRMKELRIFEDEFPYDEDSIQFHKLVKAWQKYHNDIVPWKKPKPKSKPLTFKRNVSKLRKQSSESPSKKIDKSIKQITKSLQQVIIEKPSTSEIQST